MSWVGITLPGSGRNDRSFESDEDEMNLHEVDLEHRREIAELEEAAVAAEKEQPAASIGLVGAPDQRFRHIKNRKYMRRLYIVLAALACIFIFSSLLRMSIKSNNDSSKSSSNNASSSTNGKDMDLSGASNRMSHLMVFMKENTQEESEIVDLESASTPQRFALQWMADDDPMQLDVPETRFDEVYHAFIQRYSAAVLAFAWGVDTLAPLNFLSAHHECDWNADYKRPDASILTQGIICDKGQVIKIDLQTIGISGSIPREIGHLHTIQRLHLDGNKLTGHLPQMMHRLQDLSEWTMTRNKLSGHVPSFVSKMASLRHLELSKNLFSGHLTYPFGGITEEETSAGESTGDYTVSPLRVLALDNNRFGGPIHALAPLILLEELYLNNNSLTGQIGERFMNASNLAIVDVSNNKLEGKIPDYFIQLPALGIVDLHSNAFSEKHPHGNSTALKYFDLHDNQITGALPRSIGKHPNLAYYDVSRNSITSLPDTMGRLKNLQYLFLSHNPTLEAGPLPEWIMDLNVLNYLSLKNTARTGNLPEWLGNMNLVLLDLELNRLNGTIPESMGRMTSAEYMFLNRNDLSGSVPSILGNLTDLVLLNLDHNDLSGRVPDPVCAHDFEILIADCTAPGNTPEPLIECACCSHCCDPMDEACNTRDWGAHYGEAWGGYWERYNIIEDGDVFELVGNIDENLDGSN